jgi:hypothetical protein
MSESSEHERWLNVVLEPGSRAHHHAPHPQGGPAAGNGAPAAPAPGAPSHLAAGFQPQPDWNMTDSGGPTIANLTFVNRYLGGAVGWAGSPDDIKNIDGALSSALSDPVLESVIAQYFQGPITSAMLPSAVVEGNLPATFYKDNAEATARQLHDAGALGDAAQASSVICMMLPQGIVLSDDFSPGFQPPAAQAEDYAHRKRRVIKVGEDDAADSRNGLGGYHGSIHLDDGSEVYYAVGVYSETAADGSSNGIDAFGVPWKNVVATFYHELNEARTDAAVEDVNSTNNDKLLGWYSQTGQGEIGDLPINACQGNLKLVFQEVPLAGGAGTVPIQLMWSNADDGPASSTGA